MELHKFLLQREFSIAQKGDTFDLLSHIHVTGDEYPLSESNINAQFFTELCRKVITSSDTADDAAFTAFMETEAKCQQFNESDSFWASRGVKKLTSLLRIEMAYILGKFPGYIEPIHFSSGATTSSGRGVPICSRFAEPECDSRLYDAIADHFIDREMLFGPISVREHANLRFVAKNAKISRVIIVGQNVNQAFERAGGIHIRTRLKYRGINLDTRDRDHFYLAYEASLLRNYCTHDVKNSSNSLHRALFKRILPREWFEYLDTIRTKSVTVGPNDVPYTLQMFMGNGNGFCFELQTAFYAALIRVVSVVMGSPLDYRDIFVFGDDMIYPQSFYHTMVKYLDVLGITTNTTKTFHDGSFYESCGGEFYHGHDVKPIHLKSDLVSDAEKVILLNKIRRKAISAPASYTRRIHLFYCRVLASIEKPLFGPSHYGDSVILYPPFVDEPQKVVAGRGRHSYIRLYGVKPSEYVTFLQVPFNKKNIFQLLAGGYMRGWGSEFTSLKFVQKEVDSEGKRIVPPGRAKNLYRLMPKPGCEMIPCVTRSIYYPHAGLVNEQDPVNSVFAVLRSRSSFYYPSFIYCTDVGMLPVIAQRRKRLLKRLLRSLLVRQRVIRANTHSAREVQQLGESTFSM